MHLWFLYITQGHQFLSFYTSPNYTGISFDTQHLTSLDPHLAFEMAHKWRLEGPCLLDSKAFHLELNIGLFLDAKELHSIPNLAICEHVFVPIAPSLNPA